jgi:hypothetical protein
MPDRKKAHFMGFLKQKITNLHEVRKLSIGISNLIWAYGASRFIGKQSWIRKNIFDCG